MIIVLNDPPGVPHQVFKQGKLPGLQIDLFSPRVTSLVRRLTTDPDAQPDRIGNTAALRIRLHPGQEFREGKRLGKVIVCPISSP